MLDERSSAEQTSLSLNRSLLTDVTYLSIGVSSPMLQAAVCCEIPCLTSQGQQATFEQDIPLRLCWWKGTDTDAGQKIYFGTSPVSSVSPLVAKLPKCSSASFQGIRQVQVQFIVYRVCISRFCQPYRRRRKMLLKGSKPNVSRCCRDQDCHVCKWTNMSDFW